MRHKIITLGIVLAGIFTAQAQEVKFGVRTGLNLSDLAMDVPAVVESGLKSDITFNTKMRAGFHIGAFAEVGLSDTWFVEAGVAYSFQGANLKSGEAITTEIATGAVIEQSNGDFQSSYTKVNMLNIPVWVKYDIAGFRPKVGFNLGFMTNVETKLKIEEAVEDVIAKEKDKNFDFGLGIGAEYNLPMGLFFDATFNLGLTKLSQKTTEETSEVTFKNRVFQIGVGYKF